MSRMKYTDYMARPTDDERGHRRPHAAYDRIETCTRGRHDSGAALTDPWQVEYAEVVALADTEIYYTIASNERCLSARCGVDDAPYPGG
jgi:hypothetical protein